MKRFGVSRWNRILVWTGAALAWGTAFIAARAEPARTEAGKVESTAPTTVTTQAILPEAPARGLVVIRYTPIDQPVPEVRRVYVQAPSSPARAASAPSQAAPAPSSSGS